MSTQLDMDASQLAEQIKLGKLSSKDVTETYIRHLSKVNDQINCLTQDRFTEARKEAELADKRVERGERIGKLHGVPISVKDCFHVAGMSTTSGLLHRRDLVEREDADIVKLLKDAGAIIVGKTNTPQLCFCQETDNKLHGRTNNPWNLERSAGGSSGGEGACIAVGGAAVGIGADIGGSIRFPSHFNGVIGFKSGADSVSARGNFPEETIPEQQRMLGIGAMAKSVRDARLIHEIIAREPIAKPIAGQLSSYSLIIPGQQSGLPLGLETAAALDELRVRLSRDFTTVNELPPLFTESALVWQQVMSINGARHIRALMSERGDLRPVNEYLKAKLRRDSEIHPYLSWALIGARTFRPSAKRIAEIGSLFQRGDAELDQYYEDKIVILPVYHRAAMEHGMLYKELFSIKRTFMKYIPYVAYANVWGLPALTVPYCEDADGMPIGLQLISRKGNEAAIFELGELIEQLGRGYVRCRHYD